MFCGRQHKYSYFKQWKCLAFSVRSWKMPKVKRRRARLIQGWVNAESRSQSLRLNIHTALMDVKMIQTQSKQAAKGYKLINCKWTSKPLTCMKWLMFSRSDKISLRFFVPRTLRRVVWARSWVDFDALVILTTDITALKTRKYTTASTATVTESLDRTCGQ